MRNKLVLSVIVLFAFVGCGSDNSGTNNGQPPPPPPPQQHGGYQQQPGQQGQPQQPNTGTGYSLPTANGACSAQILTLFGELTTQLKSKSENNAKLSEIEKSCQTFKSTMGAGSCMTRNRMGQSIQVSYTAEISKFCADVESHSAPTKNHKSPHASKEIDIEDLDGHYELVMKKTDLKSNDLLFKSGNTRCKISFEEGAVSSSRNNSITIISAYKDSTADFDLFQVTGNVKGTQELVLLKCKTTEDDFSLQDLNDMINDVAEIRRKK